MAEAAAAPALAGIAAAPGIVIGPLLTLAASATARVAGGPAEEHAALAAALAAAETSLGSLIAESDQLGGEILEFQLLLLADDELLGRVRAQIDRGVAADAAVAAVFAAEIAEYQADGQDYLAARASDLIDLRDRILRALGGAEPAPASQLPAGAILLADDLPPSTFLELARGGLGGIALRQGSATSHVAILARARGIPAVVGLGQAGRAIAPAAQAVLDGDRGTLIAAPSAAALALARQGQAAARQGTARAAAAARRPAVTRSGDRVAVLLNVDDPAMLDALDPALCDGIGLTRTEFLCQGPELPSEDEQAAVYARILRWAAGRPVTIRTLDAGGDKPVPGLTIEGDANPFLGARGLRLSLLRPEPFRRQLRALARAAALGDLRVMLPMVTVPAELALAAAQLDAALAELEAEGVACARPPLGVMIEVPAAAMTAAQFAADFYSIGSNDLVQYVTACARDNPLVQALAEPTHPAVLELIRRTVAAGRARQVEVSLCGDMASVPALIPILLAQGVRRLSVAPAQLGAVKLAIAACDLGAGDAG